MQTDLDPARVGATIAGRIKGTSFQLVLNMSQSRLDRVTLNSCTIISTPELFALAAEDPIIDPHTGATLYEFA